MALPKAIIFNSMITKPGLENFQYSKVHLFTRLFESILEQVLLVEKPLQVEIFSNKLFHFQSLHKHVNNGLGSAERARGLQAAGHGGARRREQEKKGGGHEEVEHKRRKWRGWRWRRE